VPQDGRLSRSQHGPRQRHPIIATIAYTKIIKYIIGQTMASGLICGVPNEQAGSNYRTFWEEDFNEGR
jgi:hypothetical protein